MFDERPRIAQSLSPTNARSSRTTKVRSSFACASILTLEAYAIVISANACRQLSLYLTNKPMNETHNPANRHVRADLENR
jgi:hypothetical protein